MTDHHVGAIGCTACPWCGWEVPVHFSVHSDRSEPTYFVHGVSDHDCSAWNGSVLFAVESDVESPAQR